MKLKLLLFQMFLMVSFLAFAQNDTIKTLLITEAHLGSPGRNFVEITNMGTEAVDLSNFELGATGTNDFAGRDFIFPEGIVLDPGESYFIGIYHDFNGTRALYLGMEGYTEEPPTEFEMAQDYKVHVEDYDFFNDQLGIGSAWEPYDSIGTNNPPIGMFFGRQCIYLEQHFPSGDSAQVDQVMGVFDTDENEDGILENKGMAVDQDSYDVAGYPNAGSFANLIRKFSVKQGNLTFVRGNSEADSEWLAIENLTGNSFRKQPWTFGNHGDFDLTENTLEPMAGSGIEVDFQNRIITVPWGTYRPDGIMAQMEYKPGVAWFPIYTRNSADSLSFQFKTGDSLLVVVAGNDADRAGFRIEVEEPTASENRVTPMMNEGMDYNFFLSRSVEAYGFAQVTDGAPTMDTITGLGSSIVNLGIPPQTRIDTLLERLEKPAMASWEIVPVDGNSTRPDLVEGDILKVTAEDGTEKEYYIKVSMDVGNNNAFLSSITWPDIPDPELFEFLYGWTGDTVPRFGQNITRYQLKLPSDIETVPATVAKPVDVNANVEVERAVYLKGSQEDRTTTYTVTATDDTTILEYILEWQPEEEFIQPFSAEPFISEFVTREYFGNDYLEICNPGNVPLDLSDYMIVGYDGAATPAEAIAFNPEDWTQRYFKYIPGYKWVDEATWANSPGFVVPDPAVNATVAGGDVFVLGEPSTNGWWGYGNTGWSDTDWPGAVGGEYGQSDVNFYNNDFTSNPWGEEVASGWVPIAAGTFGGEVQYIFKILNDSIKDGLKAATDPNDFELIEILGEETPTDGWMFGWAELDDGHNFTRFYRKPEFNKPNPVLNGSMGDTPEESEFVRMTRFSPGAVGGWPMQWTVTSMMGLGEHYFIPPTEGLSTVLARIYKVSPGYSMDEDIQGLVTGVTVSGFYEGIIKRNEGQALMVKSSADGSELGMDDLISNGDTLVVTSADQQNTTKYVLEVTEDGLNSDAVVTSELYDVNVTVEPTKSGGETQADGEGEITGFEYGTQLKTVINNIELPAGATMTILDGEGGFVPLTRLNFDTVYVDVTVNTDTYLEVVAEDGITTIVYQLQPQASSDAAFITSDYFNVSQNERLVQFVPSGISVNSFLAKLVASSGASLMIVDKSGLERTMGSIAIDDEIVVTSESGNVTNSYFIQVLPSMSHPNAGYYLAYVLSDMYPVNQVENKIGNLDEGISVDNLTAALVPAPGATMEYMDADDDGMASQGDMVVVTSADGRFSTTYIVDVGTSAGRIKNNISLYPNPTQDRVNISGLEVGSRIQVFNYTGAAVRDFKVRSNIETISLNDQPSGMYLIRISDASTNHIGRYKLIKR